MEKGGFLYISDGSCVITCDSGNLFAILKIFLRFWKFIYDSKIIFAILEN